MSLTNPLTLAKAFSSFLWWSIDRRHVCCELRHETSFPFEPLCKYLPASATPLQHMQEDPVTQREVGIITPKQHQISDLAVWHRLAFMGLVSHLAVR